MDCVHIKNGRLDSRAARVAPQSSPRAGAGRLGRRGDLRANRALGELGDREPLAKERVLRVQACGVGRALSPLPRTLGLDARERRREALGRLLRNHQPLTRRDLYGAWVRCLANEPEIRRRPAVGDEEHGHRRRRDARRFTTIHLAEELRVPRTELVRALGLTRQRIGQLARDPVDPDALRAIRLQITLAELVRGTSARRAG